MKDQSRSSCGRKKVAKSREVQGENPGRAKCRIKGKVHLRNKGVHTVPQSINLVSSSFFL